MKGKYIVVAAGVLIVCTALGLIIYVSSRHYTAPPPSVSSVETTATDDTAYVVKNQLDYLINASAEESTSAPEIDTVENSAVGVSVNAGKFEVTGLNEAAIKAIGGNTSALQQALYTFVVTSNDYNTASSATWLKEVTFNYETHTVTLPFYLNLKGYPKIDVVYDTGRNAFEIAPW
jgi:hypothetical protein